MAQLWLLQDDKKNTTCQKHGVAHLNESRRRGLYRFMQPHAHQGPDDASRDTAHVVDSVMVEKEESLRDD